MVWKSHKWKRALQKLQNRYRILVVELFSTVSNEEARIARIEFGGELKSLVINASRKDEKKLRTSSYKQL
jgi:hypothetical protein